MQRTNIYLDERQLRALKHIAIEDRQSVAELIRCAVDAYLAKRLAEDTAWRDRLLQLLSDVQSRMPADVTPEEIEADISAARDEVRQERRAARSR